MHQECGVDADDVAVAPVDVVGVGVSADAGVRFEQRDPVACRQRVGGDQAGDSAADYGDRPLVRVNAFHIEYSEPCGARMGVVPSCRPSAGAS